MGSMAGHLFSKAVSHKSRSQIESLMAPGSLTHQDHRQIDPSAKVCGRGGQDGWVTLGPIVV